MILVTGATGTVGSALVTGMCAAGLRTRALVRNPERADVLRGYDCEVAVAHFEDAEKLRRAFRGIDAVFVVAPDGPRLPELERRVYEAAAHTGVSRVVKLAAIGYDGDGFGRIAATHRQSVEHLRDSGLPHTILAANDFMQNLLEAAASVQERGELALPRGDFPVSQVDARDIAAAAAVVLAEAGHEGRSYLLTGPESVTPTEVAGRLSEIVGHEVRYVHRHFEETGDDGWLAAAVAEIDEACRAGLASAVSGDVERLTGRPPRPVQAFLADHRSAFVDAAPQ